MQGRALFWNVEGHGVGGSGPRHTPADADVRTASGARGHHVSARLSENSHSKHGHDKKEVESKAHMWRCDGREWPERQGGTGARQCLSWDGDLLLEVSQACLGASPGGEAGAQGDAVPLQLHSMQDRAARTLARPFWITAG